MEDLLSAADLFESVGRYGYRHPGYAESFVDVGDVRHLRRSGAWMLTRAIPGTDRHDALIGHPLLVCGDWEALADDLVETAALANVVTVSALTDPLARVSEAALRESFPDLVRVHAQHYLADLTTFWPSRDHRRAVRRAMELVDVEIEDGRTGRLDAWISLADGPLRGRLGLSRDVLQRQLAVPGCVGLTALAEDGPVAMAIVYVSGENAHLHVLASSPQGEELGARFALIATAVEDMAGRGLRTLDLGVASAVDEGDAHQAQAEAAFMDGWTELTRPSYLCGRIVDRITYDRLAAATGTTASACFPVYRDPSARLGP